MAARGAVWAVFFTAGAGLATWFPYIPTVQHRLHLSNGTLGLCLLSAPIGSIGMAQVSANLIGRFGSRDLIRIASILFFVNLPLPVLARNPPMLVASLLVLGAATGLRNVAMNTQAVEVERIYGRPILTGFHAAFSLGSLASAGLAVIVIGAGWSPGKHVALVAAALLTVSAVAARALLRLPDERSAIRTRFTRPNGTLLKLGTIAICLLIAEGAMADWASVFVRNVREGSPRTGAAAYAAFVGAMAIGRLLGDKATQRLGPVQMLRVGGLLICGGLLVATLAPLTGLAIGGFGGVGLGVSCGYPIMISAAGRVRGAATAAALTVVTTIGAIGFLAGPPLIGLIAQATSLRVALLIVAAMGLLEMAMANEVDPARAQDQAMLNV